MSYTRNNPNPCCILTPDCVVRAVAHATGKSWDRIYAELSVQGFEMCTPFVVNNVWGAYLDDMEMSGARGRDTRTGRFVSRDTMRSDMISGRAPRRMYYGESYDERDDGDLEEQLEDMINDRTLPNSKRDAARKMLAEIRKGNI